jgi:2-haloacid dehalogenase
MARLHDFKVLTFDCYGTLIDWESGIWDAMQPLLMAGNEAGIHRVEALAAFAKAESATEHEIPDALYPDILYRVHEKLADRFGVSTNDELNAAFANSVGHWPAFPDTADALRELKKHYRLVILSNVNRDGFAASNRKLGVEFDAIYTAEDVGSYKPSPANFEYLLSNLEADFGLGKEDILHTAQSLFHDHVPAKTFGLANAWIDRQRLSESGAWGATARIDEMPDIDFKFFSMGEMAEAVAAGD